MTARQDEGVGVIPRLEVTPEFFSVLGTRPLLGRAFEPDDGLPGRNQVALLTHGYWQRRFGGDPAIVGKTLASLGQPHTVVGVLPPDFQFFTTADVVTPLVPGALEQEGRTHYYYWVVGRLKSGFSAAQAEQNLDGLMGRIAQQFPSLRGWEVTVEPLQRVLVEPVRPALLTLLATVGLALLIGCVNVANLLLSRAVERNRELAIRVALGASRARLMRQMLTESALLAGMGGLLGGLLAVWMVKGLGHALPDAVSIANSAATVSLPPVRVDGGALIFGAALSALTVLLFGLLPALRFSAVQAGAALKAAAARTTGERWQQRTRHSLIGVEVALATALLIVAGLMARTVFALVGADPGFRPDHVLALNFGRLHELGPVERARYYDEVVGIIGDVREVGLDKPAKPMMFVPYHRAPRPVMGLFVQSDVSPDRILAAVQRAVWSVPPAQPIFNVHGLEQVVADSISVQRLTLWISAALAALAAVLTAVGIYGVVSYTVAQRTQEIGVRVALGAQNRDVLRLVVGQGMKPVGLGLLSGLAGGLGVTRWLESQLYGVSATDPLTFTSVALLLSGVALLACYLPARRATKVDPLVALRYE